MSKKKLAVCICFSGIIIYMILFPENAVSAAKNSINLCLEAILPTIFVFLICSAFLIKVGFAKIFKKPFSKIMTPLFGVTGEGALAMILGYISGYPSGAICICQMYKSGDLKKREAEKMLGFCNNASPLFIIGTIGVALLGSKKIGYMLCIIHILSSIISGMILRFFTKKNLFSANAEASFSSVRLSQAISESISSALSSIAAICAYTVLFSVIISMTFDFLPNTRLTFFLRGITEITNGISKICTSGSHLFPNMRKKISTIAFILGFGGMCVHLQVLSIVKKANLKTDLYFSGKLIQAIISAFLAFLTDYSSWWYN